MEKGVIIMQGFENWVEKLPETLGRVVVRVGGRGSLQQSAVIAILDSGYDESNDAWAAIWTQRDQLADQLRQAIEDAGHPDEYPRVRLDPFTIQGKRLPSKQWTSKSLPPPTPTNGIESALQAMAGGMVAMSAELRRSNADLCRVLSQEREYSAQKTAEYQEAREAMRDNDTILTAMELLEAGEDNENQSDPLRQSASDLLSTIGPAIASFFQGAPDGEKIKEWVVENMDDLVSDPAMQSAFFDAYMSGSQGKKAENTDPTEEEKAN